MRTRILRSGKAVRLILPLVLAAGLGLLVIGLAAAQGGGSLTRITAASHSDRNSYDPSLSGDGTKVAFYSDSDFLGQGIPDGQGEIWLYDTATMTFTRVTVASDSNRESWSPSLSGDGTEAAFESDSDFLGQGIPYGQHEIWLYDAATMTVTRITVASDSSRYSWSPSLSGDGTRVAFISDSDFLGQGIPDGQDEIWLYDVTTMTVTRVTTASHGNRGNYEPSLSGDGTKVAFVSDSDFLGQGVPEGQDEIWLYDTAAMTVTRVTVASDSNRDSYDPSLSADGTRVVFESDSDFLGQGIPDGQFEIWLYDTAMMTVTRITTASDSNRDSESPSLSGDGTEVAFASDSDFLGQGIPYGQHEIWLHDTAAMTVTRVTTASHSNRDSYDPSLSADGTKVAFESNSDFLGQGIPDGQREIWLWKESDHRVYLPLVLRQSQ